MIDAKHLDALEQIVGKANLSGPGPDARAYETGARNGSGHAAFVVRPADAREVSKVVAYAVRNGIHLIPQAGNTGLVSGSTPDDSGRQGVLSVERLRDIDVDAGNRSATAGAGVRLSVLNDSLAGHGLFYPIDLGADPMIGGMVATNTGGARFIRYGDVRRSILGLQIVLANADGTILELGSDLRKNNVGLDLKHLFVGSSGALGVVTRASIELQRLPAQSASALLVPRDDAAIMDLLSIFEEMAGNYLTAFEGMSGLAMKAGLDHVPSLRNPFARGELPPYAILVELTRSWPAREGEMSLDTVLETIMTHAWEQPSAPLSDALVGNGHDLWALRHAISEGVKAAGRLIGFDLSFRRTELPRFRDHMRQKLAETFPAALLCDFGHVGDGGVHFNVVLPSRGDDDPGLVLRIRDLVIATVVNDFGGSFSAEHALGRSNQAYYDRYHPAANRLISARLVDALVDGPIGSVSFGTPA